MKRIGSLFAVLALVGLACLLGDSQAQDSQDPSIKEIMTKAHKGGNSILKKIGKELRGTDVPWADVSAKAKDLVKLGESLAKASPKKGDKASWDAVTAKYNENAKALEKAAAKMDKAAAETAFEALDKSCMGCHKAHK